MFRKCFCLIAVVVAMVSSLSGTAQTAALTPYASAYNCAPLPFPIPKGHMWGSGATYSLMSTINAIRKPFADLAIVVAHRGYWENCPENSLEAFHAAIDTKVEAVEIDLRLSTDGTSFVMHDYNLRGEASRYRYIGDQGSDMIYALSASAVSSSARGLVDRHGQLFPSKTSPETRISLRNLLSTYVQRELATSADVGSNPSRQYACAGGQSIPLQVQRGPLVILDLKGDDVQAGLPGVNYGNTGQYAALQHALADVVSVECSTGVDLSLAIAYKLSGNDLPDATTFQSLVSKTFPNHSLPQLIPIIFPKDFLAGSSGASAWSTLCTYFTTARPCNEISALAGGPNNQGYANLVVGDWQLVYPNTSAEPFALAWRQAGGGVAGFMGVNSFPEGFRASNGTCVLTDVGDGSPTLCRSQPLTAVASSSLDYLVPSLSLPGEVEGETMPVNYYRMTSVTTDWFQNAVAYLSVVGRRNTSHIQ